MRQVRELGVQGLLGTDEVDAVVVRTGVPDVFLEYLEGCGIAIPRLLAHPRIDPSNRFRPFGWNEDSAGLNDRHDEPAQHPDLDVVGRVNARSFALAIERELGPGPVLGALIEDLDGLESYVARSPATRGWVVKAEHGNAGLANRRLRHRRLTSADRRFVEDRLAEDDRLVVEPWLPRERDWCVVFDAPFDPRRLRVHEAVYTADGALIGALFEPRRPATSPPIEELGFAAERVAASLVREGYFGPVCVDAFTWTDGDRPALRPLVDLNCRLAMSDAAYRLWRRLVPERTLLYRFFNRRKFDLGDDLPAALEVLGPDRYDPGSRRGILLTSPLRLGHARKSWRPAKLAVAFVAGDRSEVFELERRFRRGFEV